MVRYLLVLTTALLLLTTCTARHFSSWRRQNSRGTSGSTSSIKAATDFDGKENEARDDLGERRERKDPETSDSGKLTSSVVDSTNEENGIEMVVQIRNALEANGITIDSTDDPSIDNVDDLIKTIKNDRIKIRKLRRLLRSKGLQLYKLSNKELLDALRSNEVDADFDGKGNEAGDNLGEKASKQSKDSEVDNNATPDDNTNAETTWNDVAQMLVARIGAFGVDSLRQFSLRQKLSNSLTGQGSNKLIEKSISSETTQDISDVAQDELTRQVRKTAPATGNILIIEEELKSEPDVNVRPQTVETDQDTVGIVKEEGEKKNGEVAQRHKGGWFFNRLWWGDRWTGSKTTASKQESSSKKSERKGSGRGSWHWSWWGRHQRKDARKNERKNNTGESDK